MASSRAFGTWPSAITSQLLTAKSITIPSVIVDSLKPSRTVHLEARPFEEGRNVPVSTSDRKDLLPPPWSSRTAVHEYGGVASALRDGRLFFSDAKSNRIHALATAQASTEPTPVTPENENHRFADFVVHPSHPHLLISILEDHTNAKSAADVVTSLVSINTKTLTVTTLVQGADFYAAPRISPDGQYLAYVTWDHPNMPWDNSQLFVGKLETDGSGLSFASPAKAIAGGKSTSVDQPVWSSASILIYLSDVSDFYNPWIYDISSGSSRAILPSPVEEDYTGPAWSLGESRYTVLDSSTLLASPTRNGFARFTLIDIPSGRTTDIQGSPYVTIRSLQATSPTSAIFVGGQTNEASSLVVLSIPSLDASKAQFETLKVTTDAIESIPSASSWISSPQALVIPDPKKAGRPIHVLYTPPKNPGFTGLEGEKPPVIVNVHGGPTSRTQPELEWNAQYFTSRGFGWLDVNYSGSSEYGRSYRDRLRGEWGLADTDDCITAARAISSPPFDFGDPERVFIRGRSSGGYTVLQALVRGAEEKEKEGRPVFRAGTSSFGISDLVALAGDTHKFESRYGENLLGGTYDEVPQVYHDRSPLHFANQIVSPLLMLQGTIDRVVPPNQSEAIAKAIEERNGEVKLVYFEGEGHGWRKSENIRAALEEEVKWYRQVLGLPVEEDPIRE